MKLSRTVIGTFCIAGLILAQSVAVSEPRVLSVENVYKEKSGLVGNQVTVKGKVVKVNNGVMNRNFLHIQDGSGAKGTDDLTITSDQTAKIGDQIEVTGTVVLDTDFGFGYKYPLLVEKSSITVNK